MSAGNSVFNEAHDDSSAHACLVHNATDIQSFMPLMAFHNDIHYFPQLGTTMRQLQTRCFLQWLLVQILQLLQHILPG